jgi:hypothetical protein
LTLAPKGISVNGLRIELDTDLGSNGKLQVKGFVEIDPILELNMGISCNRKILGICAEIPDLNMEARLGLNEQSNLDIKGNINETFEKELELYTYTFSPIVITVGIPLVFVPKITLYLGTQGKLSANLTFSVSQTQKIVNGFTYNSDTGFKKISERESTYDRSGPNFSADTDLKAYAGARFQVLLYNAIGPYGEIEAGPHFEAHVNGLGANKLLWKFEGCLWLNIGVKIDVFTYEENFETNLFQGCSTFAEQNNRAPTVSILRPVETTEIFQGISTRLESEVFDFDEQSFTCQWRSSNATDPVPAAGCNGNIIFPSTGLRTLTLTATDSIGVSTSQAVTVTVKPTPQVLVRITNPLDGSFVPPFLPTQLTATITGGTGPYTRTWYVTYPVTSTGGTIGTPPLAGSTVVYTLGEAASLSWTPDTTLKLEDLPGCEFDLYAKLTHVVTDSNAIRGSGTILIRLNRIC